MLTIKIDGRPIDRRRLRDELQTAYERTIVEGVCDWIESQVLSMRCPKHDAQATISLRVASLDDLSFEVEACCNRFKVAIEAKVAEWL